MEANAGVSRGYRGEILEAAVNWVDFKIYEAALTTDVLVNSASATTAGELVNPLTVIHPVYTKHLAAAT